MRSFKIRVVLIFFSFITMIILLFVGYSQIEKKNDYLLNDINKINQVNKNISKTTIDFQSSLLFHFNKQLDTKSYVDSLLLYSSNLDGYIKTLDSLKGNLVAHSINFDNEFNVIFHDINVIKTQIDENKTLDELSIKEFYKNIDINGNRLNDTLRLLNGKLTQIANGREKELKSNASMFFLLLVVLFLVIVYFLAHRLTRDLRELNLKIETFNELDTNFKEEPLISNIDEIRNLDKAFELIKSKLRLLESDLEEATKISEYKSVFLANMSYEIRTPLNSVLGMINMLKKSQLTTEQQIQLEIAEYSSEHVLQLANMILDNSKVEGGEIKLELSAIDLKSDLSRLIKVFEYEAWDNSLNFEFKFLADENQKFLLLADIKRIKQILTNLLNNAIKFTNAGTVSLIIDQTVGPDDYQIVTFYVKDTGIGIPPDKAKRIFNDSDNNHLSIMDYYGGTGLGLTASSQLIKAMGGELKLESKENEGSIFYFSIQLQRTLNLEREKLETSTILLNQFDYKFSVLVAEDNTMNQKVIKFLLEQQGADCTFVKNGSDAVKLFNILDFDMVFMDIFMPEMDGYEATKLIKKSTKYAERNIPIIAVSASAFEEDIKTAKEAGIDDFLAKPIETKKLKELLVKYAPKEKTTKTEEENK
ncbi:response regulator [Yeosuana marina]|uniref:response regulator n=1 Tax=Yeosuana marina TaxID=1565536 RepID=UPI00142239F2|nr:response regulator [Yeosuana marina]